MKRPKHRSNYAAMRAKRVECGIWRHFDPVSGWQRFRVYTSAEGVLIQEYFPTLSEARAFLAELKSGPQAVYPGIKKDKRPDHRGRALPRGVQLLESISRGKYATLRYSASLGAPSKGGRQWFFPFDPDSLQDADRARAAALAKREWAVARYGRPKR